MIERVELPDGERERDTHTHDRESGAADGEREIGYRVWHGATEKQKWPLNDGQIPNPDVVRVAPGTGHHSGEGNRQASRNNPVSDLPPRNP